MKKVTTREETRKKILTGVNNLGDVVSSTLGAEGNLVIYEEDLTLPTTGELKKGRVRVTKDGVTVARHIHFEDPVENLGAQMVKQAANMTVAAAGDGTTTSTLLAQCLTQEIFNYEPKSNRLFLSGIEEAKEDLLEIIEQESEPVTDEKLRDVSYISANNDEFIGKTIADAFIEGGKNVFVTAERSKTRLTHAAIEHGITVESGFVDAGFINDEENRRFVGENVLVFCSTAPLKSTSQLEPILEVAVKKRRPLLMIANLEPEISSALLVNKMKGNISICIVKPPLHGPLQKEILDDLMVSTGGKLHGLFLGDSADILDASFLGTANFVFSNAERTVLRLEQKPELTERVKFLEKQISEETEGRKQTLEKRLANLVGALGVIYVGGDSESEREEILHRVDDAIRAVYSARQEGILPGGGVALKNAAEHLEKENLGETNKEKDYLEGYNIMLKVAKYPFYKILSNANLDVPANLKFGMGVDAKTGKVIDVKENGIIDPTLVVKQTLINAVSVAKQLANVSSSIVWK